MKKSNRVKALLSVGILKCNKPTMFTKIDERKTACITGAGGGIGIKITQQLLNAGINVVGLENNDERIQELIKMCTSTKGKLYTIKTDIEREEEIINAFKWIKENVGALHILINNAGIIQQTTLINGSTEKWKKTFNINVIGLCITTREAIKIMIEENIDGHIVHINSIAGHTVVNSANINVYPASKYAVTALTETLRQELNRNQSKIKITSVSPGKVDTQIMKNNHIVRTMKEIEIKKLDPMLKPEDIADAVLYALSTPAHVQVHELTIKPVNEKY